MSDTVLGCIVVSVLAIPGALMWIYWVRRVNRMSVDEQEALNEKWRAGSAGGSGGCGGGCGCGG